MKTKPKLNLKPDSVKVPIDLYLGIRNELQARNRKLEFAVIILSILVVVETCWLTLLLLSELPKG